MVFVLRGTMRAHTDAVTAIATPISTANKRDMIVSGSRDNSVIVWHLTTNYEGHVSGVPRSRLIGHSDSVEDVVLSSGAEFALSCSSDAELRLWDLKDGFVRRFVGHSREVLSVAFSENNRQILSASRDNTIKVWDVSGECKYTIQGNDAHTNSVACVRYIPNTPQPTMVTCSWDKTVKIWNFSNCNLRSTLAGHNGYVNTVAASPDGSLCASGGNDGVIFLWDSADGIQLHSLEAGDVIHAICLIPNMYWLCAATESAVMVWDLQTKNLFQVLKVDLEAEAESEPGYVMIASEEEVIYCTSMSWSVDGETLFCGFTDGVIRAYGIETP